MLSALIFRVVYSGLPNLSDWENLLNGDYLGPESRIRSRNLYFSQAQLGGILSFNFERLCSWLNAKLDSQKTQILLSLVCIRWYTHRFEHDSFFLLEIGLYTSTVNFLTLKIYVLSQAVEHSPLVLPIILSTPFPNPVVLNVYSETSTTSITWKLTRNAAFGPHLTSSEPRKLGCGTPSQRFWYMLKLKKHWSSQFLWVHLSAYW